MKHLTFLLLSLTTLWSCQNNLNGEGTIQEKEITLSQPIEKITFEGNFDLILIQEPGNKVIIEAQENLLDNFVINQKEEDLTITEENNAKTEEIYKVYLYSEALKEVEIDGNASFDVAGELRKDEFKIEVYGNSRAMAQVFIDQLEINLQANSSVSLNGNCSDLEANIGDNGKMISPDLVVTHADIALVGNAQANFQIIKELDGKSSGNSVLEYKGNPDKDFKTNDQSKIIKID